MRELRVECFVLNHTEASAIRDTVKAIKANMSSVIWTEMEEMLGHIEYLLKVD